MHPGFLIMVLSALLMTALGGYLAARLIYVDPESPDIAMTRSPARIDRNMVRDYPPATLDRHPAVADR